MTLGLRAAAIIVGLIAACAPALAKDSHIRKAVRTRVAALQSPAEPVAEPTAIVRHRQAVKASRKRGRGDDAASLIAQQQGESSATPAGIAAEAIGWRVIEDPATGARLGLPEKLVPRAATTRIGSRWTSAQGQIQIETFRLAEAALPALFEEEKKASRRQIASSELKPDSFVITGVQGLKNFLVRADAHGSEVRGITILYDQATEGIMSRVALVMAGTFAGFPDPKAGPLPGMRRAVEYGTAIVVSGDGALIAPAHLIDECQVIAVPPLGHAERLAADKANDLALLRLYGARNLVPAPIGGDAGPTGDLTLVGIADPLAQAGEAGVSSTTAHLGAQGIELAPTPGFSGAAAVDSRGALAGMVDVKPAIVAGGGAVAPGATLLPAATIRAFLQAQGVASVTASAAAEADHVAIDQSVLRVVCVRK
ncbi:MAG: serine protease [Xanthobacteraceae bacterium]|nr:serine protease [Xanthobacteraceae bacterium]